MPVTARLVRERRAAAERLRRQLSNIDGTSEHPYFRSLARELGHYEKVVTRRQFQAACSGARLILVGDYHALSSCSDYAAELLGRLHTRRRPFGLGVEFVFARQQPILDRRQRGEIGDEEFLHRIHYREEWGYPWEGLRNLLDTARSLEIPVHALDTPPRRGARSLRRRDGHAARRIGTILDQDPKRRLLVLFGETHMAQSHLPAALRRLRPEFAEEGRLVRVFQNPDRIHWARVTEHASLIPPVRISSDTYAVFHTGPLEKYEAYRHVLEVWSQDHPDDDDLDRTPAVHHVVDSIATWLGLDPHRYVLQHHAGWMEDLGDAYPEVYAGPAAVRWLRRLSIENGRTPAEIREAKRRLEVWGVYYEPRANAIFLERYRAGRVAAACARFLRTAFTGRLFLRESRFSDDPVWRTYGAAYTEALAFLCARLIDPAMDLRQVEIDDGLAIHGKLTASATRWLSRHREFENGRDHKLDPTLQSALRRSRTLRRRLAIELGRRLGSRLYERVQQARLSRRQVRNLFTATLCPEDALQRVLRILRARSAS
jgi:hypothetical protein